MVLSTATQDSPLRRSYAEVLDRLSPSERADAAGLPFRIGITKHPDGSWEDYTGFELLYDMPVLVARDLLHPPTEELLGQFRFAHHCVGFCGLVRDRIADGQVLLSVSMERACGVLETVARQAIQEAVDPHSARHIRRAFRFWFTGVATERRVLSRKALDPAGYAALVFRKTSWLVCMTLEMIATQEAPGRVDDFKRLMGAVILAMQARDDAMDADEDAALHGCSFPEALGVDPLTLGTFGQWLLRRAVDMAEELGFSTVSKWLETNQTPNLIAHLPGEPLLAPLGAILFANSIGELWCARRTPGLIPEQCGLSGNGPRSAHAAG
jgi:hypothetical protein